MYLHNTLTRHLDEFKPLKKGRVGLYTCGPTVYNFAHLGNLRTYIFEDVLKRVLLYQGYKVKQVMNITDVDDKTIQGALSGHLPLKDFTKKFTEYFKFDIKKLNILPPAVFAPATNYIKEMVKLIQILLKKDLAYKKGDSIYFSINHFKEYGRLSQLDKRQLKTGARVEADEYEKDNPADFALWRGWTEKDGPVFWQTALGKGRPGWHIECSAISTKLLGQPFDIHCGAVDLIFPHHENEIAQSEAATGKKFVNFWLHGEHLLVEGQKMAKSLNNFFTLRDLETRGFNPLAFRYLVLTAHYRSKLNFTWEALGAAEQGLAHLYASAADLKKQRVKINSKEVKDRFVRALKNDLDLPAALSIVWAGLKKQQISYATLLKFDQVLGLNIKEESVKKTKVPARIQNLLNERKEARKNKNWAEADRLREEIKKLGFMVEDTESGQAIKKI